MESKKYEHEDILNKLTDKQELFCNWIVQGLTLSEAYRKAYSTENMSNSAIHTEASRSANHPKISLRLAELKSERMERLEFDSDRVLEHLSAIVQTQFSDIFDSHKNQYKPIEEWPLIWRQMAQSHKKIGNFDHYTFINKTKALELLGKHTDVGAFVERLKIETFDRASILDAAKKRVAKII